MPSARAWSLALELRRRPSVTPPHLLVVAEPARTDEEKLPFALMEAASIRLRFSSVDAASVLPGTLATAEALRPELARATHVHFACHGLFRPSDPRASALLLAGDDRLTLGQVLDGEWPLATVQLAVLSACQTAVNEFRRTPDESTGFPAALLLAGIPSVVATLWPIDDTATMLFCDRFYELYRDGGDATAAVQVAHHSELTTTTCFIVRAPPTSATPWQPVSGEVADVLLSGR